MKRTLAVGLSILLLFSSLSLAFGAGEKEGGKKEPVLGIAMISLDHPFFANMMAASQLAAQDYGVRTIWKSAEGSLEKQIAIIENYIQQKVDCILIDPIDKVAIAPAVVKVQMIAATIAPLLLDGKNESPAPATDGRGKRRTVGASRRARRTRWGDRRLRGLPVGASRRGPRVWVAEGQTTPSEIRR